MNVQTKRTLIDFVSYSESGIQKLKTAIEESDHEEIRYILSRLSMAAEMTNKVVGDTLPKETSYTDFEKQVVSDVRRRILSDKIETLSPEIQKFLKERS